MSENLAVVPWLLVVLGGPLLLGIAFAVVLMKRRSRNGADAVVGRPVRPHVSGRRGAVRSLWGLGGRDWSWSPWTVPVLGAVLIVSALVVWAVA